MKQVRAGSPRKKSTSFSCCLFEGLRLAAVSVTSGKRERARERALDFGVPGGGRGGGQQLKVYRDEFRQPAKAHANLP